MNKCDYFTVHSADSGTFLKLITLQTRFTSCFPVVNEKQGLSVTLITRRFLQCQLTVKKKKAKLLLSGLNKTLFPALYMSDVSHHVTWIGMFSEWPLIKRKKFAHLGFFNIKGMYGN